MSEFGTEFDLGFPITPLKISENDVTAVAQRVESMKLPEIETEYYKMCSQGIFVGISDAESTDGDPILGGVLSSQFNLMGIKLTNLLSNDPATKPEDTDISNGQAKSDVLDRFMIISNIIKRPYMTNCVFLKLCTDEASHPEKSITMRTKLKKEDKNLLLKPGNCALENQMRRLTSQYPAIFDVVKHIGYEAGRDLAAYRHRRVEKFQRTKSGVGYREGNDARKYGDLIDEGFSRIGFTVLIACELTIS